MDGKKRIARLRNAEKWKKLGLIGFGALRPKAIGQKAKTVNAVIIDGVAVECKVDIDKIVNKAKKKFEKAEMTWDNWNCQYVPRQPPIPGVFGTSRKMIEALQKKGFKVLGSGHYSTVLGHPKSPDKVIKLTRHQDNWIDYVKWAAENGYAGGFGPKVYSWKKFPAGWSWAVIERMERCVGYCNGYDDEYSSNDDYSIIFSLLSAAQNGNTMATVYAEDLCPGAVDYVKKLRSVMRASDIRAANTMVRKDGSLCFTDPCAGTSTLTTTRLKERDFVPSVWRYFESCYRYRSQWA